jgi:choline dehydrogenase-like flavoprotein
MTRIQRYTSPGNLADGNYMTVVAMLAHPLSRGSVHIRTSDPNKHPRIDSGYLTHPLDEKILAKHVLQIEKLLDQDIYSSILRPNGNRLPREYNRPLQTEDEAKEAIRKYSATNYHPCGTCVMTRDDLGGVVDGQLKVHGTVNLRDCDASIFPIIPRGNILSTVYAMAEQGADIILRCVANNR